LINKGEDEDNLFMMYIVIDIYLFIVRIVCINMNKIVLILIYKL